MIGYFDTSAVVPILVAEPSSTFCRDFWGVADDVVTSRLTYVEAAAALSQARRLNRVSGADHRAALANLGQLWGEFGIVEVDEILVRRAAELAYAAGLREYDAVHCASAEQIDDSDLVVASGDQRLLAACAELGLATADTNG